MTTLEADIAIDKVAPAALMLALTRHVYMLGIILALQFRAACQY